MIDVNVVLLYVVCVFFEAYDSYNRKTLQKFLI